MTFILVLFAVIPQTDIADESVAMVELNHFYDADGKHVLDQLIFYDWNAAESTHDIIAWRLCKKPSQRPVAVRGRWISVWHDGDTLRRVRAEVFRETWTQFDPESIARKTRPKDQRRELTKKRMRR